TTRDFSSERTTRRMAEQANQYPVDPYDEYEEIDIIEERLPVRKHPQRPRRGKRVFSTLATGCLGGVITLLVVVGVIIFFIVHNTPLGQNLGIGKSAFNQSAQQTLTLGSATQLIVKNQTGNITINVDRDANTATL